MSVEQDLREHELARIATVYRDANDAATLAEAKAEYQRVYLRMLETSSWHGVPDVDSQLPLEDMPAAFLARRAARIARHRRRSR